MIQNKPVYQLRWGVNNPVQWSVDNIYIGMSIQLNWHLCFKYFEQEGIVPISVKELVTVLYQVVHACNAIRLFTCINF